MIACGSEVCAAKSADPRFAQQILGSEVCVRDPRIIAQSSDPRFAQQNPRMVRIRTLRITYVCQKECNKRTAVALENAASCVPLLCYRVCRTLMAALQ